MICNLGINSGYDLPLSEFEMGLIIFTFVMALATFFFYCYHDNTLEELNFEFVIIFTSIFLVMLSYFGVIDSIFQVIGYLIFIVFVYIKLDKGGSK